MAINMKPLDEVKPKVKEYASVGDYFDDVITKTYDVIKQGDAKKWNATDVLKNSQIRYLTDFANPYMNFAGLSIENLATYVKVSVKRPEAKDAKKPNAELTVIRKHLPTWAPAADLAVYKELEGALKTGLKQYEHARVAFKQ